jgi:hypothetical protein
MEIKNFGSLYLNGQPSELNAVYGGGDISLGDTVPGKAIHFVKWKDLWVASEIVCPSASWTDLNKHNFITGWPIRIDGVPYLCRSLKVGEERDVPNEWDDILNDLGEDNSLWHWDKMYFWGQETFRKGASYRAVRGYYSARRWYDFSATFRNVYVGFRPALEPLPPASLISDSLIGATLMSSTRQKFGKYPKPQITQPLTERLRGALDICFEQNRGNRRRSYGESNQDMISRK